jgi:hypothetical protein
MHDYMTIVDSEDTSAVLKCFDIFVGDMRAEKFQLILQLFSNDKLVMQADIWSIERRHTSLKINVVSRERLLLRASSNSVGYRQNFPDGRRLEGSCPSLCMCKEFWRSCSNLNASYMLAT